MKTWRKWNSLQILLAVVIAFSGICTYSTDTYSLFCHENSSAPVSIVSAADVIQIQPDVCNAEQVGALSMRSMARLIAQETRLHTRSIRQRGHSKRAISALTGIILSGCSNLSDPCTRKLLCDNFDVLHSTKIIIEYMHHQDGSKS